MIPSSETTEVNVTMINSGGQQFGRFVPDEFQRQLERRFHQPIGQARGRGGEVLLQFARDALPFGGLQRRRRGVHRHFQTRVRLHRDVAALQIHVRRLNTAQRRLGGLRRQQGLIGDLEQSIDPITFRRNLTSHACIAFVTTPGSGRKSPT